MSAKATVADESFEACMARISEATSSEKARAIAAECQQADRNAPSPLPYAKDSSLERVTWQEALEWWPYRPLLQALWLPKNGALEALFVMSRGRQSNPRKDVTGVSVIYYFPDKSVDNEALPGVLDGGGTALWVIFYPTGSPVPYQNDIWTDEVINVRGHTAKLQVMRRSEGSNFDARWVRWEESADGGTLQWTVGNHPRLYSRSETIELIDQLREVTN